MYTWMEEEYFIERVKKGVYCWVTKSCRGQHLINILVNRIQSHCVSCILMDETMESCKGSAWGEKELAE